MPSPAHAWRMSTAIQDACRQLAATCLVNADKHLHFLGQWHGHLRRFDRLLGTFVTEAGKLRRIDLIFVPWDQWAFALLGWTGSQQYLRFLRKHVDNCGMRLNSHRCDPVTCLSAWSDWHYVPFHTSLANFPRL